MSESPVIQMKAVDKSFGELRALDGFSLDVPRGATYALLGHNGAGKTTTIRALLGLLAVDAGEIRVLGRKPIEQGREVRQRVGVLLDHTGLYDRLSALANLDYHARIHGLERPQRIARIEEVLRMFGLWDRRRERVRMWSTGMRKKLAIARSLLHRPELLLLDEPFAGLDPVAAAELRALIVGLSQREGLTVVMTTHDLAHVERSCSHVAVADHGRVLASGTLDELRAETGGQTVAIGGKGLDEPLLRTLVTDGLIESWELTDAGARVICPAATRAALGSELVRRGVMLEELHTVASSLEDVFLSLVQRDGAA